MPPYTILMLIFSVIILIYAAIAYITKDKKMIPWRYRDRAFMKDEKLYMTQFAKILALAGLIPGLAGIVAIYSGIGAVIVVAAGTIAVIWIGTKLIEKAQ